MTSYKPSFEPKRENRDCIDFVDEPQDLPPIRYASFRDPDGNLIRVYTELPD